MRVAAALFAVILSGCAGPVGTGIEPGAAYRLSIEDIAAVQKGVRDSLKDPESARFGGMAATKDAKGIIHVCGGVNARNSFGGYTGTKPYIGLLGHVDGSSVFGVIGMGGNDMEISTVARACRDAGIGA